MLTAWIVICTVFSTASGFAVLGDFEYVSGAKQGKMGIYQFEQQNSTLNTFDLGINSGSYFSSCSVPGSNTVFVIHFSGHGAATQITVVDLKTFTNTTVDVQGQRFAQSSFTLCSKQYMYTWSSGEKRKKRSTEYEYPIFRIDVNTGAVTEIAQEAGPEESFTQFWALEGESGTIYSLFNTNTLGNYSLYILSNGQQKKQTLLVPGVHRLDGFALANMVSYSANVLRFLAVSDCGITNPPVCPQTVLQYAVDTQLWKTVGQLPIKDSGNVRPTGISPCLTNDGWFVSVEHNFGDENGKGNYFFLAALSANGEPFDSQALPFFPFTSIKSAA